MTAFIAIALLENDISAQGLFASVLLQKFAAEQIRNVGKLTNSYIKTRTSLRQISTYLNHTWQTEKEIDSKTLIADLVEQAITAFKPVQISRHNCGHLKRRRKLLDFVTLKTHVREMFCHELTDEEADFNSNYWW